MQIELDLLYLLGNVKNLHQIQPILKKDQVTLYTWDIMEGLLEYSKFSKEDDVGWNTFGVWWVVTRGYKLAPDKLAPYTDIFSTMESHSPSESASIILRTLKERAVAFKVAELADAIFEGDETVGIEDIAAQVEDFLSTEKIDPLLGNDYSVSADIATLFSEEAIEGGLNWRLGFLNKAVGPIHKGNTILIAARPENGKTTMICSEITHMATQLEEEDRILVFINEEPGSDYKKRIVSAALGRSTDWIMANAALATTQYNKLIGDRIVIWDEPRLTSHRMREVCKLYNPKVLVCDQLRNVYGYENRSGTDVERLKQLYTEWRSLAKEYGPAITVHQARGDSHGERYPEQNQLEGCQTEVQGALDLQIMMGRNFNDDPDDVRGLNIVKNKLPGTKHTDPSLRHGKALIRIREDVARFEDV